MWSKINENYSVSNLGQVRNDKTMHILKPCLNSKGYERVTLHNIKYFVHILVAKQFVPNVHNKPQVNHIDGNKLNNVYTNLNWMTNKENNQHAFDKNVRTCPTRKLNVKQVKEIKHYLSIGYKSDILSKMYNVSNSTILSIKYGYNWKNV